MELCDRLCPYRCHLALPAPSLARVTQVLSRPLLSLSLRPIHLPQTHSACTNPSAPGLVFWFADADAAAKTQYPPTTFRWIDNQKEAEEAVALAKKKAAQRAAEQE